MFNFTLRINGDATKIERLMKMKKKIALFVLGVTSLYLW